MSTSKKGSTMIISVLVTLVVAGAGGYMAGQRIGEKNSSMNKNVVATVNSDKITQSDLYQRLVDQGGTQTVDDMINQILVDNAAKAAGITVTDTEINDQIAKIKDQMGGDDAFNQALQQQNMTLDSLKQYVTLNLKVTKLMSKDMKTDDATLQQYFQSNLAQFDKRTVHARQIVVASPDDAKAIKAQLDAGGDFAAIAKAKSTDMNTAPSGGDMGDVARGELSPQIESVVFGLKANQISSVVQDSDGYHIIQALEIKGTAPDFNAIKDQVKDTMIQSQVQSGEQAYLDGLKAKAKITNTLAPKTPATPAAPTNP